MPKHHIVLISIIVALLTMSAPANSSMRSSNKIRAGIPPYTVIKSVLTANAKAMEDGVIGHESPTTPHLTWLADSDERLVSTMIAEPTTQIFSIRNLGNQLELAAGAVDYGVQHLLTPVLMITSSSDNKFVQLFMDGYQDASPAIRGELDHLHLALYRDDAKLDYKERVITNVEANIDYQVDIALARYQDRISSGRLVVVGSILDFDNTYQHGAGRLIIINVNGERHTAKLKNLQVLKSMSMSAMNTNIGRDRKKVVTKKETVETTK